MEDMLDRVELELLANQLKEKINHLIQNTKIKEAKELLEEYEQLCPWDGEIEKIRLKLE